MKLNSAGLYLLAILCLFPASRGFAQGLLDMRVNVDAKKKPVKSVLSSMEESCNCSFSYNSALLPIDSLVNVSVKKQTIRHTLQLIFGDRYQYKELDNHIIITQAEKEKWFTISGNVVDAFTSVSIASASIFERHDLTSTLTDANGHFRLRLKDKGKYAEVSITIGMGTFYKDTTFTLPAGFDNELSIALAPTTYALPSVSITPGMEKSWLGRLLLSSKLRQTSANLGKFFVDKPVQASFIPGLGTHGKLSGQVTNKVSFNVLGGYGAGVNGVEVGGLFNIDKKDVKYTQIGGIFNVVSGNVTGAQIGGVVNQASGDVSGVQIGGVFNQVSGNVTGVQIAGTLNRVSGDVSGVQISGVAGLTPGNVHGATVSGICNQAGGSMKGLQVAGILNLLTQTDTTTGQSTDTSFGMKGMQAAGIANIVNSTSYGTQAAGIINISRKGIKGTQIAGICNITSKMDGVQIGLINIADTVTGYSVGLINIVKKGYHSLGFSTNELLNANLTYRTGNKKLYSIIEVGANFRPDERVYGYGIGIGTERRLSKKTGVSGELTVLDLFAGGVNDPIVIRTGFLFNWNISHKLSIFAGPTASFVPYIDPRSDFEYLMGAPSRALHDFKTSHRTATWMGWQVGFHIF
jgi:hypothetical protein